MKLNTKPLKFKCCQNRKKKEQQILFIKSTNLLNLNAGWLTGKGGGGAGQPMQGMGTPTLY
jgi:hypothetical protein